MGFSIFGNKREDSQDSGDIWQKLSTVQELEKLIADSSTAPQVIFKHSTRCGVSRIVLRNFEKDWDTDLNNANLYFLDLLAFRDVSDKIAELTGVHHQSPQLIYLMDGEVKFHRSHHAIDAEEVISKLKG